jgi:EAL domain-containing protein (putative c-di-GMP-specific phosphodiesterase class I)
VDPFQWELSYCELFQWELSQVDPFQWELSHCEPFQWELSHCEPFQCELFQWELSQLEVRDLQDPGLPETVAGLLDAWGVSAELLVLEITESTLMADPAQAMEIVRQLSAMGLRIAIDDFGTGYSSLAYLKRLAVHELKVDQSFVRHVVSDSHDVAIVRSTINLAHELGLKVVAEGIEDKPTMGSAREARL